MQNRPIVSKQGCGDGRKSFTPQVGPPSSTGHLDYNLKEHEAQSIKSKLPINFLLIDL